jgi:hypothetical protein
LLVYDSSVRGLLLIFFVFAAFSVADDGAPKGKPGKNEPKYSETFAGPVVELSADRVTVSRSILGKPAETRTFLIKPDTRVEGKLRARARVTVGFVTTDEGDVARLIVVRATQSKKK